MSALWRPERMVATSPAASFCFTRFGLMFMLVPHCRATSDALAPSAGRSETRAMLALPRYSPSPARERGGWGGEGRSRLPQRRIVRIIEGAQHRQPPRVALVSRVDARRRDER